MWKYKQSSTQLKKKKTSKVIVTEGQRSLPRVLKIANDGSKTIKVWKLDSKVQTVYLLCIRRAGNNISPFNIGRDQRPGRRNVHNLHWFLGSTQHLMNHCIKKEAEKEHWTLHEANLKLCLTASLLGRSQLLLSSRVIT